MDSLLMYGPNYIFHSWGVKKLVLWGTIPLCCPTLVAESNRNGDIEVLEHQEKAFGDQTHLGNLIRRQLT